MLQLVAMQRNQKSQNDYINKKIQSQIERNQNQTPIAPSAVLKVLIYSMIIGFVPISSYYFANHFFQSHLNFSESDSSVPSAVVALIILHGLLIAFVYSAYTEKIPDKKKVD